MRDSWRVGIFKTDKTALVTEDIYQISRNSVLLGFDFALYWYITLTKRNYM